MKTLFRNPLFLWFKWLLKTRSVLKENKGKHLKIGYMSSIHNTKFGIYNTIYDNVTISNTTIGDYVYITNNAKIENAVIGKFCSIGPDVKIGLPMHPVDFVSTFPAFFSTKKQCQVSFVEEDYYKERGSIVIGNDFWIGANALILDDITIGDGAIVAAGAVVTKDVPPYSVVGGVPAKFIKMRFEHILVKTLLESRWWDNSETWITNNIDWFKSSFTDTETMPQKIR